MSAAAPRASSGPNITSGGTLRNTPGAVNQMPIAITPPARLAQPNQKTARRRRAPGAPNARSQPKAASMLSKTAASVSSLAG